MAHLHSVPSGNAHSSFALQIFPNNSHALLQEAGIDLVDIMKDRGFYVTKRRMTSPVASRKKGSFGQANPIELPTMRELDQTSEQ